MKPITQTLSCLPITNSQNPYDSESASSSLFDNSSRDCIENEQPGMEDTYNSVSFNNNLFDNNKYFNTETYEIVDNVIIEDIFPLGTEQNLLYLTKTIPQIPTASDLMTKLVDYSDSDSGPDEPVIKRKKRCQVKKEKSGLVK